MASKQKRTLDVVNTENVEFSSLLLSKDVLKGLKKMGFKNPSPVQLKSIPLGKCGVDLIVQAKSGTGKTCVFAVVALEMIMTSSNQTQVIVLTPTREIAVQVQQVVLEIGSFREGFHCQVFIGGTSLEDDKIKLKRCHIAIGTPGRLKSLIELGHLKTDFVRLFILDEADKLLEPGSFQDQINWIFSTLPKHKQMLALSATYPEYLAQHVNNYMNEPIHLRLNTEELTLLGIKQYYMHVQLHHLPHVVFDRKVKVLTRFLRKVPFQQCMVFSNYQTRAQALADLFSREGWPASYISGNQSQEERLKAMNKLKSFQCRILVSTDLTSRGIDCDKVDLVVNLDLPWDTETYLHRVGRAGRFGGHGLAITFVSKGDEEEKLRRIADEIKYEILLYPDYDTEASVSSEFSNIGNSDELNIEKNGSDVSDDSKRIVNDDDGAVEKEREEGSNHPVKKILENEISRETVARDLCQREQHSSKTPQERCFPENGFADSATKDGQMTSKANLSHTTRSSAYSNDLCSEHIDRTQSEVEPQSMTNNCKASTVVNENKSRMNDHMSNELTSKPTDDCLEESSAMTMLNSSVEYTLCKTEVKEASYGACLVNDQKNSHLKEASSHDLEEIFENFICEELIDMGVKALNKYYQQRSRSEIWTPESSETSLVQDATLMSSCVKGNYTSAIGLAEECKISIEGNKDLKGIESDGFCSEESSDSNSESNLDTSMCSSATVPEDGTETISENCQYVEKISKGEEEVGENIVVETHELILDRKLQSRIAKVHQRKTVNKSQEQTFPQANEKSSCACSNERKKGKSARQSARQSKFLHAWEKAYFSQSAWIQFYREQYHQMNYYDFDGVWH